MNRIIILFVVFLNITSVFAQSNALDSQIQFHSFQDVLKYADEHAINIKNAIINEQIASAGKKEAKSYLYPSLNATSGYNNNITLQPTLIPSGIFNPDAPEGTFEELTFGARYNYSVGLQVQWDILNFQKIVASETAGIVAEQSQVNTQKSKFNTYNVLASTYYSILLTQESIQIFEDNVRISEFIYNNTKDKFQKGIASEVEFNAAEIKQLENRKRLSQAYNNLSRFYRQLQSQLNTSEYIKVSDMPENFILANTTLQTTHPEINWQETEVNKYESLLKQKKALLLPNIGMTYQNNYNWATNSFMDFSNANQLPQQFIGARLNIPIFNGFTSRQKIKQSKLELQQQELQLENTKLVKQKEDELLLLDVTQYSRELSDNTQIMKLIQKNDVHAENQYQSGIINLDNRLDTYEDLLNAQNNYLQSLAAYTLVKYKVYIRQIDFKSTN
jgi:outer membrane protein